MKDILSGSIPQLNNRPSPQSHSRTFLMGPSSGCKPSKGREVRIRAIRWCNIKYLSAQGILSVCVGGSFHYVCVWRSWKQSNLILQMLEILHPLWEYQRQPWRLTCPTTSPKRSGVRRSADPTKHRHPLAHGGVEVVIIGNGGDTKTGVVLRRWVCSIMVAGSSKGVTDFSVVRQFGRFLILALHTAHYL